MIVGPHRRAFVEESRFIYARARALAHKAGFNLICLAANHYAMISPGRQWIYDLYPGTQIHRPEARRPQQLPELSLPFGWDVFDAVQAARVLLSQG